MSYTEIYIIDKNGYALGHREYSNSRGFCARVWDVLCNTYGLKHWYDEEASRRLWKLVDDPDVAEFDRIVLETTFDNVIIRKEDIPRVIEAYYQFEKAHPGGDRINHIPDIAFDLTRLAKDDIIGVCFYQNSVTSNPWVNYNPEEDESEAYNIHKQTKHKWANFIRLPKDPQCSRAPAVS